MLLLVLLGLGSVQSSAQGSAAPQTIRWPFSHLQLPLSGPMKSR